MTPAAEGDLSGGTGVQYPRHSTVGATSHCRWSCVTRTTGLCAAGRSCGRAWSAGGRVRYRSGRAHGRSHRRCGRCRGGETLVPAGHRHAPVKAPAGWVAHGLRAGSGRCPRNGLVVGWARHTPYFASWVSTPRRSAATGACRSMPAGTGGRVAAAADSPVGRRSSGERAFWEGLGGVYLVCEQASLHGGVVPHYLVGPVGIGIEDADPGCAAAIADGADDRHQAGQVQGVIALAVPPDQIRYPALACRARRLKGRRGLEMQTV